MRVVFDVDGCLIDSQELIKQSYHEVGVYAPENILACEGIDWLGTRGFTAEETAAIKSQKNVRYLWHVSNDHVQTLSAYDVACRLADEGHDCHAYTGAPEGTIVALQSRLPRWPFVSGVDGITTPQRMIWFRSVHEGVYVDDQRRLINLRKYWRFVHFTGQDANELYEQIVRK
jgi:hypothetical protein